tara:strand:+ start:658 stop:864 length:207 start_codon:yes stop_codon:yes gene_type:complete
MTDAQLRKHLRVLAQHAETIAARCRAVDQAITSGEMFGVPVPRRKIDRAVKDIETRFRQAAARIGVQL